MEDGWTDWRTDDGRTDERTDGLTDGRTDWLTDGRTDERTDEWTDGWIVRWIKRSKYSCAKERTNTRTDRQTDRQPDRQTDRRIHLSPHYKKNSTILNRPQLNSSQLSQLKSVGLSRCRWCALLAEIIQTSCDSRRQLASVWIGWQQSELNLFALGRTWLP